MVTAAGPWPTIHAERLALAADLEGLAEDQWRTPSLCPGWTVHDVLGHMTATAKTTPPRFFAKMLGSGFRFDVMTNKDVGRETAQGPRATLDEFRRVASSTNAPPGPTVSWLGETIVHGEDIRRPLGLDHSYPVEALVQVADFYKGSNLLIGAKRRIAGLTLRATDTDWSTGEGPEVTGPLVALVLAMTGRDAALAELGGPGLETLRSRFAPTA